MKPVDLKEHPEGGRFLEVFRSVTRVTRADGAERSALTHIYFSLEPGEVSRFHKVAADEVWNLYRGTGVRLYTWGSTDEAPRQIELSAARSCFCHVVPAGCWQAAEPIAGSVLVGCSVGPGFAFADFELIEPGSPEARQLMSTAPGLSRFIVR